LQNTVSESVLKSVIPFQAFALAAPVEPTSSASLQFGNSRE